MSNAPEVRRADKSMSHDATLKSLQEGHCGRLTTIGPDGYPYCFPPTRLLALAGGSDAANGRPSYARRTQKGDTTAADVIALLTKGALS